MDFKERYAKLNPAQKQAVDTIDGPVMVVAGPGTGKTELLGVRVANILQKTDTLPENILCLTFTDSGANAMRERLAGIIGKDAYRVAIHTFHSFGSEVINQNGQYFYQGANFRAADELSRYEILRDIFKQLGYNNPIASKLNDEYTHLSDSLMVISELKKSGLTNDELLDVLDKNNLVIEKAEQLLSPVFDERISKNTAANLTKHVNAIREINEEITLPTIVPLSKILADSLENAINEATESNSTKPITAWRNQWFTKNKKGKFVMKSRDRQSKLRALSFVYGQYLTRMQEASLYDFDDMILRVVHAMEVFDDLRFNLQEKYQYVMVDEFQDTNMAQMRILHNLTNNEVAGDTPNILVVGDDDQAIYNFQGADISNIIDFRKNYPKAKLITLTENYRSTSDILDGSRDIITQGQERLESHIEDLDKKLHANRQNDGKINLFEAETAASERYFVVNDIKSRIAKGEKPNDIAVLTRRHHEIEKLLPYFHKAGIPVNYERHDNVLDQPPIIVIEQLAQVLINLIDGQHDEVNALLPELLSHPAWRIEPIDLWKLSIKAYDSHTRWLDVMAHITKFLPLHHWLINTAAMVNNTPLEQMLDIIIGKPNSEVIGTDFDFVSPLHDYFFSSEKLVNNPDEYVTYLECLRTIRTKLKEYKPDEAPTLKTFTEFIALNRKLGNTISVIRQSVSSDEAVNVMTAHKSKGLEFNAVYVMNVIDTVWGERARSRNRLINYPENLPLAPSGESDDDRLRLFFVAITRAKHNLNISYSLNDDKGKKTLRASFLLGSKWQPQSITAPTDYETSVEALELAWYHPIINPVTISMRQLLMPALDNYKLSVTHLHNFLDITRGGPSAFLLQNLLRFPSAKSANAAFGTAIHDTLQKAHAQYSSTGKKQAIEDIVSLFGINLKNQHMLPSDYEHFLQKGSDAIRIFLEEKYDSFNMTDQAELNFASQHSIIGSAHLSGKLDLVDINKATKTITVKDYKTGNPLNGASGKTDHEKIKLHKYKQQLIFYKLLIESARDYRGFTVSTGSIQFVEPTRDGEIVSIDVNFDQGEVERFAKLINAVWDKIINLELPDISDYDQSYKGILAFEQDLIDNFDN